MGCSNLIFVGLLVLAGTGNSFKLQQNMTDAKSKVEGGDPICIENAPWQVFIKKDMEYICGGVLIQPNIVLTAAHCVGKLRRIRELSVVAGTDESAIDYGVPKGKGNIEIFAENVIPHPKYDETSDDLGFKYDIAIIKLSEPFVLTRRISPIQILKRGVKVGEELLVTGIGMVDANVRRMSPCLKGYKPNAVSCKDCFKHFNPPMINVDGIVCHKHDQEHRSRTGDSGGPIVNSKGKLVAIHRGTASRGCQVGVSVSHQLDWIKQEIGINTNSIYCHSCVIS